MNNPYISYSWLDRRSEFPTRRQITSTSDPTDVKQVYVSRDEGDITEQGTPYTAERMNSLESRINAAFAALAPSAFVEVSGTLTAGNTTITLQSAAITTESTIECFASVDGIDDPQKVVAAGSVTLTFPEAFDTDIGVKVRVW